MKIGIFGGSFNPFHNAHIEILNLVKSKVQLDEIWIIPTYTTPSKEFVVERINPSKKYKIIKAGVKNLNIKWLKVSKVEIKRKGNSYTVDTLEYLKKRNSNYKFYLIMGDDRYSNFPNWKNYSKIKELIEKVIVINRTIKKDFRNNIDIFLDNNIIDISSTFILNNASWDLLPEGSKKYISKNKFYLKSLAFNMLDKQKYQHSISVATHAKRLAKKNNYLFKKEAYIAGLLHDLFKQMNINKQKEIFLSLDKINEIPKDEVLHGVVAALWLEKIYKIKNKRIVSSIKKHTIGSKKMSKLDKIIYVADKISSDRKGKKIGDLRRLAYKNFDETFKKLIKLQIKKLKKKNITPSFETIEMFKNYARTKQQKNTFKKIKKNTRK